MNGKRVSRYEVSLGVIEMIEMGSKHYGSHYFHPSLKTQVKLLVKYQGIKTSLRTLSRAIKDAKDWGWLWSKCRHIRGRGLKMVCRSTIYRVCDKARTLMKKRLIRARNFLTPLGVPNLAQDKVTPARMLYGSPVRSADVIR